MELVDESAVARQLECEVKTLQAWRCRGFGPEFVKIGRLVRYDPKKVESWVKSRMMTSTSDVGRVAQQQGLE